MKHLSMIASDKEILDAVREWVDLLAAEQYESAFARVRARGHWSVELLRTVIGSYGSPEPRPGRAHRVSRVADAAGRGQHDVQRFDPVVDETSGGLLVGVVQFDLPVDGSWSDLTAIFDLVAVEGALELRLDDVHVL